MINHICDRCGESMSPESLWEVEVTFTPRSLNGAMNTDAQEVTTLGRFVWGMRG